MRATPGGLRWQVGCPKDTIQAVKGMGSSLHPSGCEGRLDLHPRTHLCPACWTACDPFNGASLGGHENYGFGDLPPSSMTLGKHHAICFLAWEALSLA